MNLKKMFGGLFAAAMLFSVTSFAAEKGEWIPDISLKAQWASRYLSRGNVVNPESMTFYDFSLSLKGLYAGIWIANDQNDYNRDSRIDYEPEEIDYYIGYGYTFEELPVINSLSLDFCYTYWDYPERSGWPSVGEQQHELALGANLGVFLNPGVKICWDPENEKWYGNFNVSYDYNFKDLGAEIVTLNTGLQLWWGNNAYFFLNDRHDNDIAFTTLCWNTSIDIAICENVTFGPFATLAWALDPAYRESWKGAGNANSADGLNTLWGVQLSLSF